jgi:hypothetical protein
MRASGAPHQREPIAEMLARICSNFSSIIFLVIKYPKGLICGRNHKSQLVTLLVNLEFLTWLSIVISNNQLVLVVDSESLIWIGYVHNLVFSVRNRNKLGWNFSLLSLNIMLLLSLLLGNLLCRWYNSPNLVGISVESPLTNLSAIDAIRTRNIKELILRESLNVASLSCRFSLSDRIDLEETTLMLSCIQFEQSAVSSIVVLNIESSVIWSNKGILAVVEVDVELLAISSSEITDNEVLAGVCSQGLVGVHQREHLVEGVWVWIEENSLSCLHIFYL